MSLPLDGPEPAGFNNCPCCAYKGTGPAKLCYACASARMTPPGANHCAICQQDLAGSGSICSNNLCSSPNRHFDCNYVVAMKRGLLERSILEMKNPNCPKRAHGWGFIFGRILVGFLRDYKNRHILEGADLIIPMPAYRPSGQEADHTDHTAWIVKKAMDQDDAETIPFRLSPPVIVKTGQTPKMRQSSNLVARGEIAQQVYDLLSVVDSVAVNGARILVFDDVFTSGSTLNMVARRLKESGAASVSGLTLSRQTWAR